MIYLDWAATALPDKRLYDIERKAAMDFPGNPSAKYRLGREAAEIINKARQRIADVLGVEREQILFTSGGSESNNMVIASLIGKKSEQSIVVSELEHPSFLEPVKQLKSHNIETISLLPDNRGIFLPESLDKAITEKTRMVSILALHNETGVIQPLEELIAVVRKREDSYGRRIHFHTDMVQYWGKIRPCKNDKRFDFSKIDSASFSGHKIGAPRGVGFLYLREPQRFHPFYKGGGQEFGLRPGTENTGGICALAAAMEKDFSDRTESLMLKIIDHLSQIPGVFVLPKARLESPNLYSSAILSASFVPVPGEVMVRLLDKKGVAVSTGSACSSNKKEKLLSLKAMGIGEKERFSAIRISIGEETSEEEVTDFLSIVEDIYREQKRLLR